tara:strand:+ start:1034 stop:1726 length:693 start_codon:yes stop_codon:yes gene_type:complete
MLVENQLHILCVDDDNKIRELLKIFLQKHNFTVSLAKNGHEGEKLVDMFIFDLIILDIMMPKINGIKFLEKFRKKNINTPILMLTANNQLNKKTESYAFGCDDYLIKPFEPMELILRIKKLLNPRINKSKNLAKKLFGEFIYDETTKELKKNNQNIKLTSKEEELLEIFLKNMNKEVSREKIASKLSIDVNLRSVDVLVTRLRKKITSTNNITFLKTVRGKGYKLVSEYD